MNWHTVLDALSIGVIVLDEKGNVIAWNRWMAEHSGSALTDVRQRLILELMPELEKSRFWQACQHALTAQLSSLLSSSLHRSPLPLFARDNPSKRIEQAITIKPLKIDQKTLCIIEVHDVTAINQKEQVLKQQSRTLNWQATHDVLTGLANRLLLTQKLEEHLQQARHSHHRHSLLLMDLDKFKAVNDTAGHLAGDEVLKQVSDVFTRLIRGGDLAARLGGDEFAILLPYCNLDNAKQLALQICAKISGSDFSFQSNRYPIGISIGLTQLSPEINSVSELLSHADVALYRAKALGGNAVVEYTE